MNYSWFCFDYLANESGTHPLVIISFRKEIMFWVCYLPTLWHDVIKYPFFFWQASLKYLIFILLIQEFSWRFKKFTLQLIIIFIGPWNTVFWSIFSESKRSDRQNERQDFWCCHEMWLGKWKIRQSLDFVMWVEWEIL